MFLVGGAFVADGIAPLNKFIAQFAHGSGGWETALILGIHCVGVAVVGLAAVIIVKGVTTVSGRAAQ